MMSCMSLVEIFTTALNKVCHTCKKPQLYFIIMKSVLKHWNEIKWEEQVCMRWCIIMRLLLAWTDDFLIIMCWDLSQWAFMTSAATTQCRLDHTWTYQDIAVFRQGLRSNPSVTSTYSNSSSSLSRSTFESISNALDVEETGKDTAQTKKKKQYHKWTNKEKALFNPWAMGKKTRTEDLGWNCARD